MAFLGSFPGYRTASLAQEPLSQAVGPTASAVCPESPRRAPLGTQVPARPPETQLAPAAARLPRDRPRPKATAQGLEDGEEKRCPAVPAAHHTQGPVSLHVSQQPLGTHAIKLPRDGRLPTMPHNADLN